MEGLELEEHEKLDDIINNLQLVVNILTCTAVQTPSIPSRCRTGVAKVRQLTRLFLDT